MHGLLHDDIGVYTWSERKWCISCYD